MDILVESESKNVLIKVDHHFAERGQHSQRYYYYYY